MKPFLKLSQEDPACAIAAWELDASMSPSTAPADFHSPSCVWIAFDSSAYSGLTMAVLATSTVSFIYLFLFNNVIRNVLIPFDLQRYGVIDLSSSTKDLGILQCAIYRSTGNLLRQLIA